MVVFIGFVATVFLIVIFISVKTSTSSWKRHSCDVIDLHKIEMESKKIDKLLLETLIMQYGKEKAEQKMEEYKYYREQNHILRSQGQKYYLNPKTGKWRLINRDYPLYYK